jgi:hypothetical protein
MMDPDRSREREHWQAIAEQLGLAPEPEVPGGPQAKPNLAPGSREENQAAQASAPLVEPEKLRREPPPRRGRRDRSAGGDERPEQREKSSPPLHEEAARKETGAEPPRSAEEGTGRRRRRRSARNPAATESKARGSDAGADTPSEREKTRKAADRPKRGRGRPKAAEAVNPDRKPAAKQEIGEEIAVSQGAEDAELDDVRSLSNWNVPSWNELIASLYRPER